MVQEVDLVKIDVVFFTYNPKIDLNKPIIKEDKVCVTGLLELETHSEYKHKQKNQMGSDAYKHYKWYSLVLKTELNAADFRSKLKIIHWHIESSDAKVFTLDNKMYKCVSLIYGPQKFYWYYTNTGQNATHQCGSRFHKFSANTHTSNDDQQIEHISKCTCFIGSKLCKIVEESETDLLKGNSDDDVIICIYPIAASDNEKLLV